MTLTWYVLIKRKYIFLINECNININIFPKDFDVDDVGALCAAHGLVQLGEAEILAVGESNIAS